MVYVGQSWHTPDCRFEQHKKGYKSSKAVREWGMRLRPDLYAGFNPILSEPASEQTEAALAAKLREDGFIVISS